MAKFNWLHLTDLHLGMKGQAHLWPNVRKRFLEDLKVLHETCGSFHAVFFTGDFVQKGVRSEYQSLNRELDKIWNKFDELGSKPVLFAVPGNHDLTRLPKTNAATRVLTKLWNDNEVQAEFWEDDKSEYRLLIKNSFKEYKLWSDKCKYCHPVRTGIVPGDFSSTLEVDGLKFGVVGLNTTFLQLTAGDFERKLALNSRQLHFVCGEDAPDWIESHQACFLLTHHGPQWLNEQSIKNDYADINSHGRFVVHMYGHMHEHEGMSMGRIGSAARRTWQGCSLFGLEYIGDDEKIRRRHGYSAGQIEVNGDGGQLRVWPRLGYQSESDGWWINPDTQAGVLESDNGTRPELVAIRAPALLQPISELGSLTTDEPADGKGNRLLREQLSLFRQELSGARDPAQQKNLRRLIHELQEKLACTDHSV